MKIAIVDDIQEERDQLCMLIRNWFYQNHLFTELDLFRSGEDFLNAFEAQKYEIVFMDIYLDGMNGIETVKQIRRQDLCVLVIFLTASQEHGWEAFPLHAFDYLVKPLVPSALEKVLADAVRILPDASRSIELKVGRQTRRIFFAEISCAVSDNHHTIIETRKGEVFRCYQLFSSIRSDLLEDSRFLLCNRGILVNMEDISVMREDSVTLKSGKTYPLRRGTSVQLRRQYDEYLFKKL